MYNMKDEEIIVLKHAWVDTRHHELLFSFIFKKSAKTGHTYAKLWPKKCYNFLLFSI